LSNYNRLQSDSHFRRRQNLEELHDKYVRFVKEECYKDLLEIFGEYNQWIHQRSQMIDDFERIQQSYQKQCEDIMNYVEMIENLRTVVYRNIRDLGGAPSNASSFSATTDFPSPNPYAAPPVRHERMQRSEATSSNPQLNSVDDNGDNQNRNFIDKIRGTTKKTIQHAEESLNQLDSVIKQLRTNVRKK
jgi:archaellum component FlaC